MRALIVVALALTVAGCGAESADLFEVQRSGDDPNANVDLVINDGGTARCNKGKSVALEGKQLLDARELARGLEKQASLSIELPPAPNSILRYVVRVSNGRVAFSDTSANKPKVFDEVAAFSKDVIEDLCKIER
jgi:uncharacterized protein YbjT (DUF2867 family)